MTDLQIFYRQKPPGSIAAHANMAFQDAVRGLSKNLCMIYVLASLTNLYLARGHLLATA
jgi:hypothetical protein